MSNDIETPDPSTEIDNAAYDTTDPKNATTIEGVFAPGYDANVLLGLSIRTGVPGDRTYHLFTRNGFSLGTSPKMRYVSQYLAERLASNEIGVPVESLEFASMIHNANDKRNAPVAADPFDTEDDSDDYNDYPGVGGESI